MNSLYITTTLPYVNSKPHIGHAFEFMLGDVLSRIFKQLLGKDNVFFNVGLDEHGIKVLEKAQELGLTPEQHVNNMTVVWKDFCKLYNIEYDNFYKTSEPKHHAQSSFFWLKLLQKGDIYKKSYAGKYCIGCESFKQDKELVNGKCPDHSTTELISIEEENWFFRLSSYKNEIIEYVESHPEFITPKSKVEELKNLIKDSEDISISRLKKNVPWGVEVPNDSEQVMYVWFEALCNYLFSCGYYDDREKFNKFWNNTVQICGPDNLRFQALIFQTFLASAGIKKTEKLLVHGTILDDKGNKQSKTMGNVVDPVEQVEKFSLDAVRYYAIAGLNTYSNSSWSETELKDLYNAHLANNFGNLISRGLHLIDLKSIDVTHGPSEKFKNTIDDDIQVVRELWRVYSIKDAYTQLNSIVNYGNKYFNDSEPWKEGYPSYYYVEVLNNIYYLLNEVTELYYPVIPNRYEEIKKCLLEKKKVVLFPRMK
jgi:methionyl-tRNA synthetase